MQHNPEFERCMDFLARMIEKYGYEVNLLEKGKAQDMNRSDNTSLSNGAEKPSSKGFFPLDFTRSSDTIKLGQKQTSVVPKE